MVKWTPTKKFASVKQEPTAKYEIVTALLFDVVITVVIVYIVAVAVVIAVDVFDVAITVIVVVDVVDVGAGGWIFSQRLKQFQITELRTSLFYPALDLRGGGRNAPGHDAPAWKIEIG